MKYQISSSMEDYLETIHLLEKKRGNVRVKDIAAELKISMPSASAAVKNLEKQGFVSHPRYDLVALTDSGNAVAEAIYARHETIKLFLSNVLGLNLEIAERDACRIEHNISQETYERMSQYLETNINTES